MAPVQNVSRICAEERKFTGFVEKDSAGQQNIYSVEVSFLSSCHHKAVPDHKNQDVNRQGQTNAVVILYTHRIFYNLQNESRRYQETLISRSTCQICCQICESVEVTSANLTSHSTHHDFFAAGHLCIQRRVQHQHPGHRWFRRRRDCHFCISGSRSNFWISCRAFHSRQEPTCSRRCTLQRATTQLLCSKVQHRLSSCICCRGFPGSPCAEGS